VTELVHHPGGTLAYLPATSTFSSGLVVAAGYRLAEWDFAERLPLRAAFERVGEEMKRCGLTWEALAGVDLRSPEPLDPHGFAHFNAAYSDLLSSYARPPDGALPPYTRTNVAPAERYLSEPCVRAVQVVEPHPGAGGDFVVSGVAEVTTSVRPEDTIAAGDTSPAGMRAKVDFVVGRLAERVAELDVPIDQATTIDVYTVHALDWLESVIGSTFVSVRRSGLHRWIAGPPVTGVEFELGCKRVSRRVTLSAG